MLALFTSVLTLPACGSVVIAPGPGGDDTSGSGGTTSTAAGGGGEGGATTSTLEGGGGAVPADECEGIEASGGPPIGAAVELIAEPYSARHLRVDDSGVYVTSSFGAETTIHRIDKLTLEMSDLVEEPSSFYDLAIAGDRAYWLTFEGVCALCGEGPPTLHGMDLAGGTPAVLAELEGQYATDMVAGDEGLYVPDAHAYQLLFVPFEGGPPAMVAASGVGEGVAAADGRVFFPDLTANTLVAFDEPSWTLLDIWPLEGEMRALRPRGGAVHWLTGDPSPRVRRLVGGVAKTLLCAPQGAFELAVNDTHAFVVTREEGASDSNDTGKRSIWRVPLTGGPPQLLVKDQMFLGELQVDNSHVYWLTHDDSPSTFALWRMPLPG